MSNASTSSVFNAAKLVHKALQMNLSPSNDQEYRDLLACYRAEPEFRQVVEDIVRGLDLKVLDFTERGLIIAPSGPASKFSFRLGDFRDSMSESQKAALVMAHVAIAAVFFPSTDSVDDDEFVANPISILQLRDSLTGLASHLKAQNFESEELDLVRPGWSLILTLPEAHPEAQKASLHSVVGVIKIALNNLKDAGMVKLHLEAADEENSETYTPTQRYRVQLRELTLRKLLECAREVNLMQENS